MIVYNVTVSIDPAIQDEWVSWMRSVHIPDVMATGCFTEARMVRVRHEEDEGATFSIGYVCPSHELLEQYRTVFAPKLQAEHTGKFEGRFAAFRTFLDIIEEFKA